MTWFNNTKPYIALSLQSLDSIIITISKHWREYCKIFRYLFIIIFQSQIAHCVHTVNISEFYCVLRSQTWYVKMFSFYLMPMCLLPSFLRSFFLSFTSNPFFGSITGSVDSFLFYFILFSGLMMACICRVTFNTQIHRCRLNYLQHHLVGRLPFCDLIIT